MRYLTSALISEGGTDDRFLPGLLGRALDAICSSDFTDSVEIPDVTVLRDHSGPPSVDQIIKIIERNDGLFSLVFVHRDHGASGERIEREWVGPLATRWGRRSERLVMVVPVRETEAWVLADGLALRRALGVTWRDSELGVPIRPKDVEAIRDPKVPLRKTGVRIGRPVENYFERLSELVSLSVLQQVPSFAGWWERTVEALTDLGYRRRQHDTTV
jgi:hypothetical protein